MKKQPYVESLCWTCARAYALPDPMGCVFHRITQEERDQIILPGVKTTEMTRNRGYDQEYMIRRVISCVKYHRSYAEKPRGRKKYKAEPAKEGDTYTCVYCGQVHVYKRKSGGIKKRKYCNRECAARDREQKKASNF